MNASTNGLRSFNVVRRIERQFDQAILTRLGAPMGLTNNPAMLHEAGKEAAWNSSLRRYITGRRAGGIESRAVVSTPTVIRMNPK